MISSKFLRMASTYSLALLCLSIYSTTYCDAAPNILKEIIYEPEGIVRLKMGSSSVITARIQLSKNAIPATGVEGVSIKFQTVTFSPQFSILSIHPESVRVTVDRKTLEANNHLIIAKIALSANYIGHAALEPLSIELRDKTNRVQLVDGSLFRLSVDIVQDEGVWGTIFIVSVIILMIVSYINLGAQLDEENMRQVIKSPIPLLLGFIINVILMPSIAWFVGKYLFNNQTLYRIGSFVFACCPAASASTLWTVMLDSDKELSVGLQVLSNMAALVTMPLLLYAMEKSLESESAQHITVVPYGRLLQALLVLLIALVVGWRFVGRHERARSISRKIFRPLVFFVLIFIVTFSSVLYWHIYQMFNWRILAAALMITLITYVISAILGHLVSCDIKKAVAISISSVYKNSGISFAVLLVAFGAPDTYIAYVPCLAQIITVSLSLYSIYIVMTLVKCARGKPDTDSADLNKAEDGQASKARRRRHSVSDEKNGDSRSVDNDEIVAMNMTDIEHDLPSDAKKGSFDSQKGEQRMDTEVKQLAGSSDPADNNQERPVSNV